MEGCSPGACRARALGTYIKKEDFGGQAPCPLGEKSCLGVGSCRNWERHSFTQPFSHQILSKALL